MSDETTIDAPGEVTSEQDERPLIDPETGWNRLMVEQMAQVIQIAHEINPNSWAIDSYGEEPILSVGHLNILSVGPEQPYGLLVDTTVLNDSARDLASRNLDPNKPYNDAGGWKSYVLVPQNDSLHLVAEFEASNVNAVKRHAQAVRTRTSRWKRHREDFRQQAEQIAGVSIPEPGYLQELRDLEAQSPFPAIGTMYSQTMVNQMATSILAAHALGDACWSIFETNKRIALNVGQETVGGSSMAGMYDFVVDSHLVDPERLAWLNQYEKPKQTSSYQSLLFLRLPDDAQSDYLATLQDAHVSALRTLTAVYKKATLWNDHREDLRKQVETESGIALPVPTYVIDPGPPFPNPVLAPLDVTRAHFASQGLHYTRAQIATFYTALQTKGFVVLSGISGTGKSKIAQGFVDMLPDRDVPQEAVVAEREQLIPRVVQTTTINSALVNFPRKLIERYPLPEPGTKTYVRVTFDGLSQDCAFNTIVQDNSAVYRLYFSGDLRHRISGLDLGTMLYFRPIIENETATLVGFDIELRQDIDTSDLQDETAPTKEGNHLFLSVRPDWRDSTSLLGYFNPLTQTYEWTDFLRFILRAVDSYRANDGLAWFVILDEMNLAHVEYYFADLLSVIESGRRTNPADDLVGFTREPLRTTYPDTLDDDVPPREIHLPPNLYIIGTVNMDETTHAFSPKVLDRAFTIELTDVSFMHYLRTTGTDGNTNLTETHKQALLRAFTRDGRFHHVDKSEVAKAVHDHPEIRDWLETLNRLLARDRFHFGYRIFDEICQYIVNNDLNGMMEFEDAFDQAVFMKVLPKFSGSRARLRSSLISVLAWAIDPAQPLPKQVVAELDTHLAGTSEALRTQVEGAAVSTVAKRALDMLERVELDGFVSFG